MISIRPKIGIDVDDVLYSCNEYACELATYDHRLDPALSIEEVTSWEKRGDRSDLVFDYYTKADFFKDQPIYPGARNFIHNLMALGDVYLITAVEPQFMGIRINRLLADFPEIPKENIIMGYQKNLIHVDFLLDDSPRNILESSAKYPVVFRRPWNRHITNHLSVESYDEFHTLVKNIQTVKPPRYKRFIILYGPSGSGKTAIMKEVKLPIVGSVTTRAPREGDIGYTYMTEEEFKNLNPLDILEQSVYAGHHYGTLLQDVNRIPGRAIKAMDFIGALNVRMSYPDSVIVFVKRPKEKIIKEILTRDVSVDDKVKRIASLEQEFANEKFADFVLENDGTLEETAEKLWEYIIS